MNCTNSAASCLITGRCKNNMNKTSTGTQCRYSQLLNWNQLNPLRLIYWFVLRLWALQTVCPEKDLTKFKSQRDLHFPLKRHLVLVLCQLSFEHIVQSRQLKEKADVRRKCGQMCCWVIHWPDYCNSVVCECQQRNLSALSGKLKLCGKSEDSQLTETILLTGGFWVEEMSDCTRNDANIYV